MCPNRTVRILMCLIALCASEPLPLLMPFVHICTRIYEDSWSRSDIVVSRDVVTNCDTVFRYVYVCNIARINFLATRINDLVLRESLTNSSCNWLLLTFRIFDIFELSLDSVQLSATTTTRHSRSARCTIVGANRQEGRTLGRWEENNWAKSELCRTMRARRTTPPSTGTAMTRIGVATPRSPSRIATTRLPIAASTNPPRTRTDQVAAPRSPPRAAATRIPVPRSPPQIMTAMPGLCIARPPRARNCSSLRRMIMAASIISESPSLWYVNENVYKSWKGS